MRPRVLVGVLLALVLSAGLAAVGVEHTVRPARRAASTLVAWTPGELAEGFAGRVEKIDGVTAVSVVRAGTVGLVASRDAQGHVVDRAPAGMTIPLDALAVDPRAHARVRGPGGGPWGELGPGQALLGARSARLRGLGAGSTLELDTGQRVTIVGVTGDEQVASAEVVLAAPAAAVPRERFVVARHTGQRRAVEDAVRAAGDGRPVALRGPEEGDTMRPGGSLLPQAVVKERFGEFAYQPREGRWITQDDAWVSESIHVTSVPILGEVVCHRDVLPALRGAMTDLVEAGLAHTVDAADYAGCYGPRLMRPGGPVSRHAWGIAVDLNATTNAYGEPPTQDPRLVETMRRWGFAWGGTWLVPDGMHFEYAGDGAAG